MFANPREVKKMLDSEAYTLFKSAMRDYARHFDLIILDAMDPSSEEKPPDEKVVPEPYAPVYILPVENLPLVEKAYREAIAKNKIVTEKELTMIAWGFKADQEYQEFTEMIF